MELTGTKSEKLSALDWEQNFPVENVSPGLVLTNETDPVHVVNGKVVNGKVVNRSERWRGQIGMTHRTNRAH